MSLGFLTDLDKVANGWTGGDFDYTISNRAARAALRGEAWGTGLCSALDVVDPGHCFKSLGALPAPPSCGATGAAFGGVLGATGSVAAVAAAGVPGLSAVGITTGLMAIGAGSMATGVGVAVGIPILAAAGLYALFESLCDCPGH